MVDSVAYHKFMSILSMSSIPFMFTIHGDFVFDDSEAVVKNPDVTSDAWWNTFGHDFWGTNITSNLSHKSYRPLTVLSYRLNYLLNHKHLSATQFKVTNLVCHSICCVIIWQTLERVLTRVKFKARTVYSIDIAYSAALLFGAHPIHTEVICAVVGRADVLAAITFFLSFFLYEKAMDNTNLKYPYIFASIFFAGCSMLFKENGITVLGFCILYELIVKLKINRRGNIHICKKSIIKIITIIIAAACLLYSRWKVMGGTKPIFKPTDNPAAFSDDNFVKVATYSYLYFLNLLLLTWPQWLCYDWSMGCVPLIKNIQDARLFWVLLMYGFGILFIAYIFIANKKKPTRRLLLIAIALIIVPFLPASNIFYPVGFVIAERIMYISSIGYCLILCICLNKMIQFDKARVVSLLLFCSMLILFAGKTWQRSKAFQNEYKLFTSGLAVCPLNAKIHYNVAKVADARNMTSWAMVEYKEAIRLYPEYYQAMNNLANMLKNEKKFDEAEVLLKSAIKHKKDFPAAWMNLGIVYANTKRYDEALIAYKNALTYRSNYPDCHYNIGNLYLEMNKTEDALKFWYKAINLKPTHVPAWVNLISLLDNTGQRERVVQIMSNALKELPESASINFVVANVYGKMDKYEDAEKYFLRAISLFGYRVQPVHYFNLGVLYHRWKKYDLAEEIYKKALKIDPNSPSILKNLKKIQKLINKV